jgi:hypothetical protein
MQCPTLISMPPFSAAIHNSRDGTAATYPVLWIGFPVVTAAGGSTSGPPASGTGMLGNQLLL